MWRLLVKLVVAAAAANAAQEPPCKSTIYDDNGTKCIVDDRSDLPSFEDDHEYELFYCSHPVHGTGTTLSKVMGFIHSSIGFRERTGTKVFNFEFWALHFAPSGVLIPTIKNGILNWNSDSVVTWASVMSSEVWTHQVSLGFTNGALLNKFMDWVHQWHLRHQYYQLFSVWNQPVLGPNLTRYLDDTTCNTFTEDGLTELHRLGAPLKSEEVLCRTYVVLDAAGPLQPVREFSAKRLEMIAYYEALGAIIGRFKNMTWPKALELTGVAFLSKKQPFAFIYDRDSPMYYKAILKEPYLEVWPMYLSQRMALPWQPGEEAQSKECDPWHHSADRQILV